MKVKKQIIGHLEKCYALTKLDFDDKKYLAVAAEIDNACYLYDYQGNYIETLWEHPGGVMSMEQYPNQEYPTLLSTWKFYSPDNGAESKTVYYLRKNEKWERHTLCTLPFVHRFGIVERNHEKYLVACTIKSAAAYPDDWTCPGRVWVARLPKDLSAFDEGHELDMRPIINGLTKNHGFSKFVENGTQGVLVGTHNGIFKLIPPENTDSEWTYSKIISDSVSDMIYLDFDDDGENEIMTFSPFHGNTLSVYKKQGSDYEKIWEDPRKMPFLHAIYPMKYKGTYYGIYGYRENELELNALYYDKEKKTYDHINLDTGAGPTNVLCFQDHTIQKILAANRETNEIAIYILGD